MNGEMYLITLYYRIKDEPFQVMQQLLTRKGFLFECVWTKDADAPYLVIAGIEPMYYDDFLIWIEEQRGDGQPRFHGKTLADLGFSV